MPNLNRLIKNLYLVKMFPNFKKQGSDLPVFPVPHCTSNQISVVKSCQSCKILLSYSHGHFWFVKNQFFWNFCFSVKDAEKFIKHHLFIYKRFTTDQNFKGVTQKLRLPRPWQVQNWPNYTMPFYYVKVPK